MRPLETEVPERFRVILSSCAEGAIPANIAVLRLMIEAIEPGEAGGALRRAIEAAEGRAKERLEAMRRLLDENPQAFRLVKSVLRDVEHGGTAATVHGGVEHWAGAFDRMARASAEGAVALYTLGNPDLLREATAEVVAYLRERGLIHGQARVLDLGCGIGRFVAALSPQVAAVTGLDVAPAMIDEARRRCEGLGNVTLAVSSGRGLDGIPDGSVDLLLAADVFPYLVQAGLPLVAAHLAEAARVLAPGGRVAILNFSYRGDPVRDAEDLRRLADSHGLALAAQAETPFLLWDAAVFRLVKAA